MPNPVMQIENVSKLYRLGLVGTKTLSDDVSRLWARLRGKEDPFQKVGQTNDRTASNEKRAASEEAIAKPRSSFLSRTSHLAPRTSDYVWALKDINLEVEQGEILGIIGRNGAGKSTLLKLLSRVTGPTTGTIRAKGRIASLLEVGTGFHPELTGRENVYLNGAILGMTRNEIDKRLDEIVDFSGCERYIDTPVKRYSSGMLVRLGFAVAAHLNCEILIVDEVLAVGDVEFQRKCIGKMGEVASQGRTVLFVSHNMLAVRKLCSRAVLLEEGKSAKEGRISEVVDAYLMGGMVSTPERGVIPDEAARLGTGEARFRQAMVAGPSREPAHAFRFGQHPLVVNGTFEAFETLSAVLEVSISTTDGIQVTISTTSDEFRRPLQFQPGHHEFSAEIDVVLIPGRYCVMLGIHNYRNGRSYDFVERAIEFEVLRFAADAGQDCPYEPRGFVRPAVRWMCAGGEVSLGADFAS